MRTININTALILHCIKYNCTVKYLHNAPDLRKVNMFCTKIAIFAITFVILAEYASSNFLRHPNALDLNTREIPVLHDKVELRKAQIPLDLSPVEVQKEECAKVGEYVANKLTVILMCTYHSDCCSNSCLGFLRRCVSG